VANSDSDRHSEAADDPVVAGTPQQIAATEAENALRQFDRLERLVSEAVEDSSEQPFRLRPSHLTELNRLAITGLHPRAGAFRTVPITIQGSGHTPPPHEEVLFHVEEMCDYVNDRGGKSSVHLGAYVMWRLNWIHPFYDGNGRTTRAASYLVMCAGLGYPLPGTTTIPEIISRNKQPYYDALEQADVAWRDGRIDLSEMEGILEEALASQLASVIDDAQRSKHGRKSPRQPGGIVANDRLASAASSTRRTSSAGALSEWKRPATVLAIIFALIAALWTLHINWDHPRVKYAREFISSSGPSSDKAPLPEDAEVGE